MNQSAMVTVPCVVTVAAGVFAPGHLGELTRYLPFELVDDVLEMTGAVQKRMRALPSRVGMYFVLAMTLFPGIGYLRVWDKMTGALEDLGLPRPSEKALRDLRRRLGAAPAKAVFETVAVPLASPWTRGVTWRGLRTVAFDGLNSVHVPDSDRNRCWLGKLRNRLGVAGYPAMRIVALAETGTRGLLGAVIGGSGERAEVPLARKLSPCWVRACCCWLTVPMTRRTCSPRSPRPGRISWSAAAPAANPQSGRSCPTGPTCPRWTGCRCGSSKRTLMSTARTGPGSGTATG